MNGRHETNEQTMISAHKAGAAYWNRNKPHDAARSDLESLARSCGWHGEDCAAWLAGFYGAKRRDSGMFTKGFGKFACAGDSITCEIEGFTAAATLYRDDCSDSPEKRSACFWPSREPEHASYVKPENYDLEMDVAQRVMDSWKNDEWFYCGIAVTVSRHGVLLTGKYDHALWGVECNYPGSDNEYLRDVANENLSEAIESAKGKLELLRTDGVKAEPARPFDSKPSWRGLYLVRGEWIPVMNDAGNPICYASESAALAGAKYMFGKEG